MPLEKTIVARVMAEARRRGWFAVKMHGSAYTMKGLPDVLLIKDGRTAWMEVKQPDKHPTRIQEHVMRQLAKAGCPVTVVRSVGDCKEFLEAIE